MMPGMGAPAAAPGYGMQPNPYAQPHAQPNPYANPYAQQGYNYQAQNAGAQLGSALNSFGNAFGSFVESAVGGLSVGARVMVQWSNGQRYPATVTGSQAGQLEVAFPDGRRVWVPQAYVSLVY